MPTVADHWHCLIDRAWKWKQARYSDLFRGGCYKVVNKIALGSVGHFLAQSEYIKLALPQAAQLSIHFLRKSEVLQLREGPK